MDVINRAVGCLASLYGPENQGFTSQWENLPGDIFLTLSEELNSCNDTEAIRSLRSVCRTWRHHTDTRLQKLRLRIRNTSNQCNSFQTFRNIKELTVLYTYNCPPTPQLLRFISSCSQLAKLKLYNCKQKAVAGFRFINGMSNLRELHLEGILLRKINEEGIVLEKVETLLLNDCRELTPEDYRHMTAFTLLNRLILINVTSTWKFDFWDKFVGLEDLAVIDYSHNRPSHGFSCLTGVKKLRRLVLHQAGFNNEAVRSLPSLPMLQQLSLEGIVESSSDALHHIASRFPRLISLTIQCDPDANIVTDSISALDFRSLQDFRIVNCSVQDASRLNECLPDSVAFTHIRSAQQALKEVLDTLDFKSIEDFLKKAGYRGFDQVPVFGEYFSSFDLNNLASKRRCDLIRLLVEYGANVDYGHPVHSISGDPYCSTALHFAVHCEDEEGVRELIELGADVDAHCSDDERTPLHFAAAAGNVIIAGMLLDANADVNSRDWASRTPLHSAVTWRTKRVIKLLLERGANSRIADMDLLTPIHYAARVADCDLLQFLIDSGMDVNEGSEHNLPTPLHVAASSGRKKAIRFLLDNGADASARDIYGHWPLLAAAKEGREVSVLSLLEWTKPSGEDLNERDSSGITVLHHAAANGWSEVVEKLISLGADVNRTDLKGFTALYYADLNGHTKIVTRLTKEGGLARWVISPTRRLRRCPKIGRGW